MKSESGFRVITFASKKLISCRVEKICALVEVVESERKFIKKKGGVIVERKARKKRSLNRRIVGLVVANTSRRSRPI